jgi:DNA-binding transcriptional ArsR family regulator
LESSLLEAQSLAGKVQPNELVEQLSHGIHLENIDRLSDLALFPSWWVTPLAFLVKPRKDQILIAYGARPQGQASSAGMQAPEFLVNALKSLGDPTRLQILRYLAERPLSPSELSRRLRLRPPTVVHHLRLLRLANLVQITVNERMEKRYAARPEALQSVYSALKKYLVEND